MDKAKTLESIQNARRSHEAQMAKIETLIAGKSIDDPTAVSKTKCGFGMWLYAEENHVKEILGSQFYNNLESLHAQWHNDYFRIYQIFFKEEKKKGFFSKFLPFNKVDQMEIDKAKLYFSELQVLTNELLHALGSSERRISALNESKFF
ncbi:CZB domain-containing protein [bacterium]|nr:CZB domain-containing protein [bacterium]